MATLNWVRPSEGESRELILDGIPVKLNTHLRMRARDWITDAPSDFFVRRVYSKFVQRVVAHAGYHPAAQATITPIKKVAKYVYEPSDDWPAGFLGRASRACLYFDAGGDERSGYIDVTKVPLTAVITSSETGVGINGLVGSLVDVVLRRTTNRLAVKVEAFPGEDPDLELEVLTPWAPPSPSRDLRTYLREELADITLSGFPPRRASDVLDTSVIVSASNDYLPTEKPPGWEIRLDQGSVRLSPGMAMVLGLDLTLPTPARGTIAIRVRDRDTGVSVISNVIEIARIDPDAPIQEDNDADQELDRQVRLAMEIKTGEGRIKEDLRKRYPMKPA